MRRLILSLAAVGSMAVVVGCNHTAGVCDCDKSHNPVPPPMGGHIAPVAMTMAVAPAAPAEMAPAPVQTMPEEIAPPMPVPEGK
jgi:hypothetical protein